MTGFEVFARPQARRRRALPSIAIDRERGAIRFRAAALRMIDRERPVERMSIVFDLDSKRWGLAPSTSPSAYRLHRNSSYQAVVSARAFVTWWGASGEYNLERAEFPVLSVRGGIIFGYEATR